MDLKSLSRIRTACNWLRKTSLPLDAYPKLSTLSIEEADAAKKFAVGAYPTPARWTVHLYDLATRG